ncbi:MAG: hypothetical protein WCF02_03505, partial [Azonexus sp.]
DWSASRKHYNRKNQHENRGLSPINCYYLAKQNMKGLLLVYFFVAALPSSSKFRSLSSASTPFRECTDETE